MDSDFGKILKSKRELKNLSIEYISKHTRISKRFIKKLEESNLEGIPSFYQKYFFKTYAQFLGLVHINEPNYQIDIANNFKLESEELKRSGVSIFKYKPQFFNSFLLRVIFPSTLILLIAILVNNMERKENAYLERLVNIGNNLSEVSSLESENNAYIIEEEFEIDKVEKELSTVVNLESSEEVYIQPSSKSLTLFFSDEVWVELKNKEEVVISRVFQKNDQINIEAVDSDNLFITSGNLGLISVNIDNSKVKALGLRGEIGRKKIF